MVQRRNELSQHSALPQRFLQYSCGLCLVLVAIFTGIPDASATTPSTVEELLTLHNEARTEARICGNDHMPATGPLEWSNELAEAAKIHAGDSAANQITGHQGSDGSSSFDRVQRISNAFNRVGENVASMQRNPAFALDAWINSPGHCVNIMRDHYTHMGAARATGVNSTNPNFTGPYWVVVFGTVADHAADDICSGDDCGSPDESQDITFLRSQEITVYGSENCGFTTHTRERLESKQIPYEFADIDNDQDASSEMWGKLRTVGHEGGVVLPVIDVGGRLSISHRRAADIVANLIDLPDSDSSSDPTPPDESTEAPSDSTPPSGPSPADSSGPAHPDQISDSPSNPTQGDRRSRDRRNPDHSDSKYPESSFRSSPASSGDSPLSASIGIGLGAIIVPEESVALWYRHRLHLQGHVGWRFNDSPDALLRFEPSLFAKAGVENMPGTMSRSSYFPFMQLEAGVILQDLFRVSAGLGQRAPQSNTSDSREFSAYNVFTGAVMLRQPTVQYELFFSYLEDQYIQDWQFGLSASARF